MLLWEASAGLCAMHLAHDRSQDRAGTERSISTMQTMLSVLCTQLHLFGCGGGWDQKMHLDLFLKNLGGLGPLS